MRTRLLARITTLVLAGLLASSLSVSAAPNTDCATIADGTIQDSAGNAIVLGYDAFGYNYQARMFNGTYDSSDRVIDGTYWGQTGDYVDDSLIMKWSDAWLANVDCNGDSRLDRGLGTDGTTSRGWLTNQVHGDYTDADGVTRHYSAFTKIVWVGPGGDLWGEYTVVLDIYNDAAAGDTGLITKIGAPGFGLNDAWTSN